MRITELELINVGRHEKLLVQCDAPLVGLTGPNGSGKSTILAMLDYALTGETADPIGTYVRTGASNGSVRIKIKKNGHTGEIFRQFGKTTKRHLTWTGFKDGEPIKAAAEVDRHLAEIFAADKKAISSAVFVHQGTLHDVLFGSGTERLTSFIKMVNMSFCRQRKDLIDTVAKKVQEGLVDFSETLRSLEEQQVAARVQWSEADKTYAALPDVTSVMQELRQRTIWQQKLGFLNDTFVRCDTQHRESTGALGAYQLTLPANYQSLSAIDELLNNQQSDMQQKQSSLQWLELAYAERQQAVMLDADIAKQEASLKEIDTMIQGYAKQFPSVAWLKSNLSTMEKAKWDLQLFNQRKQELNSTCESLAAADKTLAEYSASAEQTANLPNCSQESITLQRMAWKEKEATLQAHRKNLEALKSAAKQEVAGNVVCLKCTLQLVPAQFGADYGQELIGTIQSLQQAQEDADKNLSAWEKHWTTWNSGYQEALRVRQKWVAEESRLKQELRGLEIKVNATGLHMDMTALDTAIGDQRTILNSWEGDQNGWNGIKAKLEANQVTKSRLLLHAEAMTKSIDLSPAALQEIKTAIQAISNNLNGWRQARSRLSTLLTQNQMHKANLDKAEQDLNEHGLTPVPMSPEAETLIQTQSLESALGRLAAEEQTKQEAKARRDVLQTTKDDLDTRIRDIHVRMEANKKKRELADNLKLLTHMFSEQGLPRRVVEYHFDHLVAYTQMFLEQLQSRFAVVKDLEDPLSFRFIRYDEPGSASLPMQKMSGGQKVVMSLAFLMAIQRQLVQDVGFLVLDEPSVHLDEPAVEGAVLMLQRAGQQLTDTDHQIWVCDHDPRMARAFSTQIMLA